MTSHLRYCNPTYKPLKSPCQIPQVDIPLVDGGLKPVKHISLIDFCREKSQAEAARHLDVTPHAIKKMLDAERNITLFFDDDGHYVDHEEKSRVGSGRRKSVDAA
jgi:hypothetical protein